MNDEQKTALARRLASLTPQDFQAVISTAKNQRIRTNKRPIPKKTEAKFLTAMKLLRKGKQIKIPIRIEGHFDVSVGMADDSDHVGTQGVKINLKSGFLGAEIKHHLVDAFWEADESDRKDLKIYHTALTDAQNLNSDLYDKVQEACENYGQDFFEYWENLLIKAELALK
jgi:hypothetical protein